MVFKEIGCYSLLWVMNVLNMEMIIRIQLKAENFLGSWTTTSFSIYEYTDLENVSQIVLDKVTNQFDTQSHKQLLYFHDFFPSVLVAFFLQ